MYDKGGRNVPITAEFNVPFIGGNHGVCLPVIRGGQAMPQRRARPMAAAGGNQGDGYAVVEDEAADGGEGEAEDQEPEPEADDIGEEESKKVLEGFEVDDEEDEAPVFDFVSKRDLKEEAESAEHQLCHKPFNRHCPTCQAVRSRIHSIGKRSYH